MRYTETVVDFSSEKNQNSELEEMLLLSAKMVGTIKFSLVKKKHIIFIGKTVRMIADYSGNNIREKKTIGNNKYFIPAKVLTK